MSELEKAWNWRQKMGYLKSSEAVRVFHGPGESNGGAQEDLRSFAIDRFGDHYWVTQWESERAPSKKAVDLITQFLEKKGAQSAVGLVRPQKGLPEKPHVYFGSPPSEPFEVQEGGLRFQIRLRESRHPGLFLDHRPLRNWLLQHAHGMRVLNTFAYTGSLSVAAAKGGAESVTTLDLSRGTLDWAAENLKLNGIEANSRIIHGDVFQWLPRLKRENSSYDCVILDPPSFSHGKDGNFSTAKDLGRLHKLAVQLLAKDGILITSINSANISWKKYEEDVLSVFREGPQQNGRKVSILSRIDLPETFPTPLGNEKVRYLKGWILKVSAL